MSALLRGLTGMALRKNFPVGSLILVALFLLVMFLTSWLIKPPAPPAELQGVLRSEFRPLAPFHLSSHARAPLSIDSLQGKWSFFFFGYMSCPDVCPNTLHELSNFWALLADENGAQPNDLQVIFVSVDPARDSTEQLARYTAYFNPRFIAATAGQGELERLLRQFSAGYVIGPESAAGGYLVSHTSALFLVDPYGRLVATFSQPHYAATILSQYKKIADYYLRSR